MRCDAIYCGKRCRQQASRERQRLARAARARNLCPCSATLSGRRSDAVYHSDSCRLRAWRKRRRTVLEVAAVGDQDPVEALAAEGADPTLAIGVRVRGSERRPDDPAVLAADDLVVGAAELTVAIVKERAEGLFPLGQM
jgi:hypothetical protein